jgi:hypothetical protein
VRAHLYLTLEDEGRFAHSVETVMAQGGADDLRIAVEREAGLGFERCRRKLRGVEESRVLADVLARACTCGALPGEWHGEGCERVGMW